MIYRFFGFDSGKIILFDPKGNKGKFCLGGDNVTFGMM